MSSKKKSSGSHGRNDQHDRDHHDREHHGHHGGGDKGVTLKGTKGDNVLTGTDRNDKLYGLKGSCAPRCPRSTAARAQTASTAWC